MPPTHKPSPLEAYLKGLKAQSLAARKPLTSEMIAAFGFPETLPGDSPDADPNVRAESLLEMLKSAIKALPEVEKSTLEATFFGKGTIGERQRAAANALAGTARSSAPRNYSTKAIRQAADELLRVAEERADSQVTSQEGPKLTESIASRYENFDSRKVEQLGQLLISSRTPFDDMDVAIELSPGPDEESLSLAVTEQFSAQMDQMLIMHAIARDAETDEPNELAERIYAEWGQIMQTYWYMSEENLKASFHRQLESNSDLRVDTFRQNKSGHSVKTQLRKVEMKPADLAALVQDWNAPALGPDSISILEVELPDDAPSSACRYRVTSRFVVERRPKFCFWDFDRIAYVNSVRVTVRDLDETRFRVRFFGPSVERTVDLKAKTWEFSVAGWCTRHNGINIHW